MGAEKRASMREEMVNKLGKVLDSISGPKPTTYTKTKPDPTKYVTPTATGDTGSTIDTIKKTQAQRFPKD